MRLVPFRSIAVIAGTVITGQHRSRRRWRNQPTGVFAVKCTKRRQARHELAQRGALGELR